MVNIINGESKVNKIVNRLQEEFYKNPDLIIKELKLNFFNTIYIIYLETVSSSDKVNDNKLKNFILEKNNLNEKNISSFIAAPNTKKIKNIDECEFYLTNGFSLIILKYCIQSVSASQIPHLL